MVAAQTPTLAKIKNRASETEARALVSLAVCEVCDFFNVGKNMSDSQIAITTDLILESFWYLKLEEVKYCFRRAMMREKLFDRLDGNIIIGWLREYDIERTEEAIRLSEQKEAEARATVKTGASGISFEEYIRSLRQRKNNGDKDAAELLESAEYATRMEAARLTARQKHDKDLAFFQYKIDRERQKEHGKDTNA